MICLVKKSEIKKSYVKHEATYVYSMWTESLRKYSTILGEAISLCDGILGGFNCFFILCSIFGVFYSEHLLCWSSENKMTVRQPTFLLVAEWSPQFPVTPFSLALATLCPPVASPVRIWSKRPGLQLFPCAQSHSNSPRGHLWTACIPSSFLCADS